MLKANIKRAIVEYEYESNDKLVKKDWAVELGITPQYLSAIIAGRKVPDGERMFKIARKLNRKVDDLWVLEDE